MAREAPQSVPRALAPIQRVPLPGKGGKRAENRIREAKKGRRILNPKIMEIAMRQALDCTLSNRRKPATGGSMIRAGKICCGCLKPLPPPHTSGIKYCQRCLWPRGRRVYMSFMYRDGWHCQFQEWDLKTPLPKKLTFRDSKKICETALRGHGLLACKSHRSIVDLGESGRRK